MARTYNKSGPKENHGDPLARGWDARYNDHPITANPHRWGSNECKEWSNGWLAADLDIAKKSKAVGKDGVGCVIGSSVFGRFFSPRKARGTPGSSSATTATPTHPAVLPDAPSPTLGSAV